MEGGKEKNNFTIYVRDGNNLVEFASLSKKEQSRIRLEFFTALADSLLEPEGYHRVGKQL